MIAELKDLTKGRDGRWQITIATPEDFTAAFDELYGKEVTVEIKKHSRSRSLDANAYCWVLIDKIAEKTGQRKTDVYRQAIREIGGVSDTVCVRDIAVERLREGWESKGLGWQTEIFESKLKGCTNVTLYYGSSVYDSRQMAQLIDSLVQDAEALGIPTLTPKEAERLIGKWKKKEEC